MKLPKNITQIGESDHHCKVYVEDYVISYMKQLNQLAMDKDMAVALYGICKEENGVSYFFLYGASKLTFLQRETRHLSQAQQQEIEKHRKRYFQDYSFVGYRLLNGEAIEGFHVCEQGICRYISGYAQFYEKNDSMLAYMLDVREDMPSESVDQGKYEEVRRRQEERRAQHEDGRHARSFSAGELNEGKKMEPRIGARADAQLDLRTNSRVVNQSAKDTGHAEPQKVRGMRMAVVAVFAMLCLVGLSALNRDGTVQDIQVAVGQVVDDAMEQRIPNASEGTNADSVNTLITEDKLVEAVRQENQSAQLTAQGDALDPGPDAAPVSAPGMVTSEPTVSQEGEEEQKPTQTTNQTPDQATNQTPDQEPELPTEQADETSLQEEKEVAPEAVSQPSTYIIKEGDTLIGISLRNYGTDVRVSEICSLNQINNPDDIKVGQKILLP